MSISTLAIEINHCLQRQQQKGIGNAFRHKNDPLTAKEDGCVSHFASSGNLKYANTVM